MLLLAWSAWLVTLQLREPTTEHSELHASMVYSAAIALGASTAPWEVFAGVAVATGFVPQLTSCARHASQSHKHKYGRARVHFDLCTRVLVAH